MEHTAQSPAEQLMQRFGHSDFKLPDGPAQEPAEAGTQTAPIEAPVNNAPVNNPVVASSEPPVTDPATPNEPPTAQQLAEQIAQSQPDPPAAEAPVEITEPVNTPVAEKEISDEDVLKYFREKKGKDISSLDELDVPKVELTPEQKEAKAEKDRNDAIAFGIQQGVFNRKDLEAYAQDAAKNPRDTAYELFSAQLKSVNATIGEEEIVERFNEYFFQNEPEDSPLRLLQEQNMQNLHNNYMAAKYGKINSIDNQYAEHIEEQQAAANYGQLVNKTFDSMGGGTTPYELKYDVKGTEYVFQVKPEIISELKNSYQQEDMFHAIREKATDGGVLKGIVELSIIQRELPNIIAEVADSHAQKVLLEHEAKLAAIPQTKVSGGTPQHQNVEQGLNGAAKTLLDKHLAN